MRSASRAEPASAIDGRHRLDQQARERAQHRQEQQRRRQVEQGVEIGGGARRVGLDRHHQRPDPVHQRQRQHDADQPIDQIADRQPPRHRVAADRAFEERVERGAEIGAEHQREGRLRRHHALCRERDDEQHHGDARMRRPGHRRGENDIDQRLGRDGAQQQPQARHILIGGDEHEQLLQRE
jgi:hypothetical protein